MREKEERHDFRTQKVATPHSSDVMVIHHPSIGSMVRSKLWALEPGYWLGDEIINIYFGLMQVGLIVFVAIDLISHVLHR
jgi:hypothetical protein